MRKVEDYRKHAEECRQLARVTAQPEQPDQLLKMDALADERERQSNRTH